VKTLVDNIYYYQDELGSTSHIANASGALLEYYKYDLYGKPTYFSSTSQQLNSSTYAVKDLFTGQRWIPEIGLYDDRNRFMSPDIGRFLQPDPIGFKGDVSNLYRYCGNDWANRADLMGTDGTEKTSGNSMWQQEHRDWTPGSMMWDFEKRADTSGGNGSADGRAGDHTMAYQSANSPYNGENLSSGQVSYRTAQLQNQGKPGDLIRTSPKVDELAQTGARQIEAATHDNTSRSLVIQYDSATQKYSLGQNMSLARPTVSGAQDEPRPPVPDKTSFSIAANVHSHFNKPHSHNDFTYANTLKVKSFILDIPNRQLWRYTPRNNAAPNGNQQGVIDLMSY
jgi:RHS repeat-associated protein